MLRLVLLLCLGTVVIQASNPDLVLLRPRTTGQCSCEDLAKRIDDIQESINHRHCPSGWQDFRGSCYMVSGKATSWKTARADCQRQFADLVSISSAEENAFVTELATKQSPTSKQVWIGLYALRAGAPFAWVDGSTSSYTSWEKGEPNYSNSELCAWTYIASGRRGRSPGKWNDYTCGRSYSWPAGYVCELRHSYGEQ